MRSHSAMIWHDLRARMSVQRLLLKGIIEADIFIFRPPFIITKKKQKKISELKNRNTFSLRALYDKNTLSARARRFREKARAMSWDPDRDDCSKRIRNFIEACESQAAKVDNSTFYCKDLSEVELQQLRNVNRLRKPERRRKTSTKRAQIGYVATQKSTAGQLTQATMSTPGQDSLTEGDDVDLFGDANEDMRQVFATRDSTRLEWLTLREARIRSDIDLLDSRHNIPRRYDEIMAIREALDVTVAALMMITDRLPALSDPGSYLTQWAELQTRLWENFDGDIDYAPLLPRLQRWTGGVHSCANGDIGDERRQEEQESQELHSHELHAIPTNDIDCANIKTLLHPTRAHYAWFTGYFDAEFVPTRSYIEEYHALQRSLNAHLGHSESALVGLEEFNQARAVWSMAWMREGSENVRIWMA